MLIKHHTMANEELGEVAKNHNIDFPPDAPEKAKEEGKKLLDVKGAEFDKIYLGDVVKYHSTALAEYKKAAAEVKDPKLVTYTEKTEKLLTKHYEEAKKLDAKVSKG